MVNRQLDWQAPQFFLLLLFYSRATLPDPLLCSRVLSCFSAVFFFYTQHKVPEVEVLVKPWFTLRNFSPEDKVWSRPGLTSKGSPLPSKFRPCEHFHLRILWFVAIFNLLSSTPPFQYPKMRLSLSERERQQWLNFAWPDLHCSSCPWLQLGLKQGASFLLGSIPHFHFLRQTSFDEVIDILLYMCLVWYIINYTMS